MTCILDHFGLTPHDFSLHTDWEKQEEKNTGREILVDQAGNKYRRYESVNSDRFYCFMHAATTPLFHGIGVIVMIAYRALRIGTLFPLFSESEIPLSWKQRFSVLGIEILQLLSSPFLLVALEVVTIYGIFQPRDSLKLQQSIQTLIYDTHMMEIEVAISSLPDPAKKV